MQQCATNSSDFGHIVANYNLLESTENAGCENPESIGITRFLAIYVEALDIKVLSVLQFGYKYYKLGSEPYGPE